MTDSKKTGGSLTLKTALAKKAKPKAKKVNPSPVPQPRSARYIDKGSPETKELRQKIGTNIRRLREDRNMSQTQLANAIDCSRAYISQIEKGDVGVLADTIHNICQVFDVLSTDVLEVQ